MPTLKKIMIVVIVIALIPLFAILVDVTLGYGRLVGTIGRIIQSK